MRETKLAERYTTDERESDVLIGLLVSGAHDYAIFTLDAAGNVATWNAGAQRFKGYRAEEIIGHHFSAFYPAEDVAAGKPEHELLVAAAEGRLEDEGWRVRKDGTRFWANVIITALRDAEGVLRGYGKITRDLTEVRSANIDLRLHEERFQSMVEGIEDYAILILDAQGKIATWNAGAQRFKGYLAEEIIGRHFSVLYPAEDVLAGKPERELLIAATEGRVEDEGWRVRQDGTRFWANVIITALRDAEGVLRGYIKITRDLTENRSHESRLEHLADHDPLTGVRNRRSFARELNSHVARVARYGAIGAVLMLDLDNFKYINDTQGHGAGDRLIIRIAHALQSRLRESDVLARLGGDEFAVLLPGEDQVAAATVAESLLQVVRNQAMSAPADSRKNVTASVGIAFFADGEHLTAEQMMVHADLALYRSKEAGRDRWERYRKDERRRPKVEERTHWAERINDAIAHDRFELLAQPIVNLAGTGSTRFELQLRMSDEGGELLAPASFSTIAERVGLAGDVDRWLVRRAIDNLATERAQGRELRLEITLAGGTIGDAHLLALIERRLHETGVSPERLIVAISETAAVADIERAVVFAKRLARLGCGLALHDFGAASGSFHYIKQLPVDYLRIDGAFVQHCHENESDRAIISAVVHLALGMGMRTIAEVVESERAAAVLRQLGVGYGQGGYFGNFAPLGEYLSVTGR